MKCMIENDYIWLRSLLLSIETDVISGSYFMTAILLKIRMQNRQYGTSSVIFIAKLKTFLDSLGISFEEFVQNCQTINVGYLSKLEFFRIISLIHLENQRTFDPQQAFLQLSHGKEAIASGELKKLISTVGDLINQKKQAEDRARQEEMRKKMAKIGIHKLEEFMAKHPNPSAFFRQFDVDDNGTINKVEFCKLLVGTDIRQFTSKEIRMTTVDFIFKYFPKGEITMQQLAKFFKVPYLPRPTKEPSRQRVNSSSDQINPPHRILNAEKPNNTSDKIKVPQIQEWLDPFVKKNNSPKKHIFPAQKPKEEANFKKKIQSPDFLPVEANYNNNKIDPNMRFSNCDSAYPLSMKYYRQGQPQPSEYQVMEELEDLLRRNSVYSDSSNPKVHDGTYISAQDIFKAKFYIFQMAQSVLQREKSRIGMAQEIEPKDIIQGSVGDCYFLSSIASIISIYPQLIAQKFLLEINPASYYAVKLFIDGEWKVITTDDKFACKGKYPVYAKPHHNQIWVMLLEKCWAKVFGSYRAIEAGSSKEGFIALTGAPCQLISQEKDSDQQNAIKQLQIAQKRRYVATMSGSNYLESLGKKGEDELGLVSGHAYSLLKVLKIKGQTIVKLRNPWGKLIWKGDWSFKSTKWTKELRDQYNYNYSPEDGSFYMSWADFRKYFGEIIICKLNPTFMHDSIRVKTNRHKSGYFKMEVTAPGQYIVSIYQENKRKMSSKYSNYQYSQARLIILKKVGNNMIYVGSKSTSQYQVCSVDLDLQPGQYIISAKVVWKFWDDHEYVLTSYGEDHTTIVPINRAIAPAFKANMIESYSSMFSGTGKVKSYQKYGFNATCETNFSLQTGIGFIKMSNKSDSKFVSVQEFQCKGIKIIKPDKLPLRFEMKGKCEKVYGFFISPSGFEYSNTEKITY